MFILWDKIKNKINRFYWKSSFKSYTHTKHNDFDILGPIQLINKNIILGENVTIYPGVTFWGDGVIKIGDNVSIGANTVIYASKNAGGGINIGSNTQIAAMCYIIDMDHGLKAGVPICKQQNTYKHIEIGEDCWLAAGVKVLKGSIINDGAVIGAQSVVKGNIPENSIAVGVPAKVVKFRE